ncbi:hypothetical protein ABI59_10140 [Acidobacteria bacterium Mor1]|nr:hypothetical protein ABI59_10140 [Acidobacteria bacterium Mor1]
MKKPGLTAMHPSKQVFRSDSKKRVSTLQAAWVAPEMFETGIVRAHVYPLRPVSRKRWDALLTVSFPMPLEGSAGKPVVRRFGAVLNSSAEIISGLNRTVTLEPTRDDTTASPTVTFVERVELRPGDYTLTTVLADPKEPRPHATRVNLQVPEVPRGEMFLVEPILSRPSGPNLVIYGQDDPQATDDTVGGERSFEPLLVTQLPPGEDLVAFSQVCRLGRARKGEPDRVERVVRRAGGEAVGSLPAVPIALEGEDRVRCQSLVDVLPAQALRSGEYVYEALLDSAAGQDAARLRFSITDSPLELQE